MKQITCAFRGQSSRHRAAYRALLTQKSNFPDLGTLFLEIAFLGEPRVVHVQNTVFMSYGNQVNSCL